MNKNKTARKILLFIMSLGMLLSLNIHLVSAGTLSASSTTLTNAAPTANTTYDFKFTAASTASIDEYDLQISTTASGGTTKPASSNISGATFNSVTVGGVTGTGWAFGTNVNASGLMKIVKTSPGDNVTSGSIVDINISGIVNPALTDCAGNTTNADTCYIRESDYTGSAVLNDTGVSTITVSSDTTATATIDPSLTLTIAGVAAGVTELTSATPMTNNSTATTLPFGNLTTTAAFEAQTLNVATNANSGYQVTMAMSTAMTGTHAANSIQPFNAAGVTWNAPTTWSAPNGTVANTNTAWIGANTSDSRVHLVTGYAGWTGVSNNFAPVNTTPHVVDYDNAPDNGTSVSVTYELQANVSQPADTYSGTLKYNAVGTY